MFLQTTVLKSSEARPFLQFHYDLSGKLSLEQEAPLTQPVSGLFSARVRTKSEPCGRQMETLSPRHASSPLPPTAALAPVASRRALWALGLTRPGSKSCSICRSFLLFSSSKRRSFVLIRSTSLFCICKDWRRKGGRGWQDGSRVKGLATNLMS